MRFVIVLDSFVPMQSIQDGGGGRGGVFCIFINEIPRYCISHSNVIFASIARVHKRVHVHNVRGFPQAKLDSEINTRFPFDEQMTYTFY